MNQLGWFRLTRSFGVTKPGQSGDLPQDVRCLEVKGSLSIGVPSLIEQSANRGPRAHCWPRAPE